MTTSKENSGVEEENGSLKVACEEEHWSDQVSDSETCYSTH